MTLLIQPDEPQPFEVLESDGRSPYLFTVDHGGRYLPRSLGDLGLDPAQLTRHIAWDIGIAAVSRRVAAHFSAFMIAQPYSRLVIDCNRPPDAPDSITELSEHTVIPGNQHLTAVQREARRIAIFDPYHARIEAELLRRKQAGQPTLLIAMHSFTPRFKDVDREWHAGVLYNRDPRLAHSLRAALQAEGLHVGDNQPYFVSDDSDYGIPRYGEQGGLVHVELELRQDLITEPEGQQRLSEILCRALPIAAAPYLVGERRAPAT
jgi:predicted N-formylglutamate amidohydrolase